LPNVFQNSPGSIRKAAPPKEPELEPFSEEPEPYQTGPEMDCSLQALKCPFDVPVEH
jgi:hypothetical protein